MATLIVKAEGVSEKYGKYFTPSAVSSHVRYQAGLARRAQELTSGEDYMLMLISHLLVGEVAQAATEGREPDVVITWAESIEHHEGRRRLLFSGRYSSGTPTFYEFNTEKAPPFVIEIKLIGSRRLRQPLSATVERDDGAYLATLMDLPLYGYGESVSEAVEALKRELASLYEDLSKDDNFTEDWLRIKQFLQESIIEE